MPVILKNLWYRRARTLLTILGIAVGVAAVVAFSAFGEGFANGFERAVSSASADLTVAQRDAVTVVTSALDESVGDELALIPGVEQVVGTVLGVLQMPDSPYFVVKGEEPRGFALPYYRVIAGQALSGRRQIMLGRLAAEASHKAVGQTFALNGVTYRIVGIYETGAGLEDGGAVLALDDAQRAFDRRRQVSYFSLKVKDARRIDEVKRAIEARWSGLAATRSGEPTRQTEMLGIYRSFGWFLGFFAVLVGGLGMMNTSLMSVFERTREIGVLRALGWRRRRIVAMILGESLVLAMAGGVVGIGLGVGLTWLTQLSPAVESLLQGVITPSILLQAFVAALLLGTVGGFYPAWRASRLLPVEAMRAEGGAGIHLGRGMLAAASLPGMASARNLLRRPTRTLVTMAGIGIGVGLVVALIAVSDGFAAAFTQLASAGQADLVAEQAKASDAAFSSIDERVAERVRQQPQVRAVSRLVLGLGTGPGLPYFLILGLDPHEEYVGHFRIREGRAIERQREIIIGRLAAESLHKRLGDSLRVVGSSFRVVGIYENGVPFEDAGAAIELGDAQRVFDRPRQVSFLAIAVKEPARASEIARQLEGQFPQIVVSRASALTQRMQDFKTLGALIGTLIVLAVVVGGIVMMNAMLMSVFERTQEIGVLRALGWRRLRVLRMVVAESLALSLLSVLAGSALGVGLCALLRLEPNYGRFFVTPAYTPRLFGQVLALALALGGLGGLYPAWRASGLSPIEALRYE